jgi:ATP-dependent Clp protease ATP-binding subunit ClpX
VLFRSVFLDIMFSLPEKRNLTSCMITKDVILRKKEPVYKYEERKKQSA